MSFNHIKAFLTKRTEAQTTHASDWVTSSELGGNKRGIDMAVGGVDSTGNSSTTILTSGSTFTGVGEQNSFPQVGVMVKTDQAGTLYFDFSPDGTNWDSTFPTAGFLVAANITEFHTAVKLGRYFRLRLINGTGGDQTYLRITTYYGMNFTPSISPVNQSYGLDADATIVKTVPHWLQVNRGLVSGITFINKFGKNAAASAGDTIEISQNAFVQPATAEIVNIKSTSTSDDGNPEGVGAFTVEVSGIDINYDIVTETVTLNGTTNVPTVARFWHINTARVATGSTYAGAIGTITFISAAAGTPTMATIAIGSNRTQLSNYMIPRNHSGYFNLPQITFVNVNNNAQSQVSLYERVFGGVDEVRHDWVLQAGATSDFQPKSFGAGLKFKEKSIIYFKIISVGTGTNIISVDYDIWLVNEV